MNELSVLRPVVGDGRFDTTLLRVTHSADAGSIKFEGQNVANMNREDLLYVIASMHDSMEAVAKEVLPDPAALEPREDTRLRLFRVTLRGFGSDSPYQDAMVISADPTAAYDKVRAWLDANDYGFYKDRAMGAIELVAEDYHHTEAPRRLFL